MDTTLRRIGSASRWLAAGAATMLLAAAGSSPSAPGVAPPGLAPLDPAAVARGHRVFNRYCISCHGLEGDGRGPTADWIDPRPRVLTGGVFKFRSTPSGSLPTDADLLRVVTSGLHHSSMPRWEPLSRHEREDVVQFVKTLSPRFASEPPGTPVAIPPRPTFTPELARQGKAVWDRMQCAACHGEGGKGDGASTPTLRDDWGYPVTPRDFTRGPLKVGDAPEDLYRTFMTGLTGSPMPSFAEAGLTPDDAWALVAHVRSLRKE